MNIALALMPVLLFVVLLQLMDSFKLVRPAAVAIAISAGALAAVACLASHDWLISSTGVNASVFVRDIAPATEEVAKAMFIAILLWRSRIGFLVDAAVQGFAVGAVGNEPGTVNESLVRFGPNVLEQARTVAAAVPGSVLQASDSIGDAVQLVIGPGYSTVVPVVVGPPPAQDTPAPTAAAPTTPAPEPVSC